MTTAERCQRLRECRAQAFIMSSAHSSKRPPHIFFLCKDTTIPIWCILLVSSFHLPYMSSSFFFSTRPRVYLSASVTSPHGFPCPLVWATPFTPPQPLEFKCISHRLEWLISGLPPLLSSASLKSYVLPTETNISYHSYAPTPLP